MWETNSQEAWTQLIRAELLEGEPGVPAGAFAEDRLRLPFSLEGAAEAVDSSTLTGFSWMTLPEDRLRGSKAPPTLAFLLLPLTSVTSEVDAISAPSACALDEEGFKGGGT